MIRRTTWIILAIFIILLGVTLYLQRTKGKSVAEATPTSSTQNLFDFAETEITALRIEDGYGKAVILGKDAQGLWSLTEPKTDVTDVGRAEEAISSLVGLRVVTTLDAGIGMSDVGLAPQAYTVTMDLMNGKQVVLKVGKVTPIENGYYVQVEDGLVQVVSKFGLDTVINLLNKPPIPATPTPLTTPTESVTATQVISSTVSLTSTPKP